MHQDEYYDQLERRLSQLFSTNTNSGLSPVFFTNATGLYRAYIDNFPEDRQDYYSCRKCRTFIEKFGGLATVNSDGSLESAIWDDSAPMFSAMQEIVRASKITGYFVSSEAVYGSDEVDDGWSHLHVIPPQKMVFSHGWVTAEQRSAERRKEFRNVQKQLELWPKEALSKAVEFLKSEMHYQTEKIFSPIAWFLDVAETLAGLVGQEKEHMLWDMVCRAPHRFCYPRNFFAYDLVTDFAAGLDSEAVLKFYKKMPPLASILS